MIPCLFLHSKEQLDYTPPPTPENEVLGYNRKFGHIFFCKQLCNDYNEKVTHNCSLKQFDLPQSGSY